MDVQALPYYIKTTIILLGISLFVAILFLLQELLIPIVYAAFLAILLYPLDRYLEKHKIHRVIAISLTLLAAIVALGLLCLVVASQVAKFTEHSAELKSKLLEIFSNVQQYVQTKFGFSGQKQKNYLDQMSSKGMESTGAIAGSLLGITEDIVLVPIYAYLFLYYRELFEEFLLRLFVKEGNIEDVRMVLRKNSNILFDYLVGKAIETVIVIVLSAGGLYLFNVDYALLFGILAGLFNLVPFIGAQISAALPMLMAILTKDSIWYPVGIFGMFTLIQFIDNHFVIPLVIGQKISLNAFTVVIVLIAGDMLWGISGMILSMPLAAILKVVFDSIPGLQVWGLILGNKLPPRKNQLREK